MKRILICILAGGLSTRMGREKARLRLGSRTLLGHVKIAARTTGLPVRILRHDIVPRCGPIGGIYTALTTTRADAVLFLACDMPFVSSALISRVVAAHKRTGQSILVECQGRRGFPCLIPKAALPALQKHIARKQWSVQRLAHALGARTVRLPRRRALEILNINTPNELAVARQIQHRNS